MPDYVAAYDDVTAQLAKAQEDFVATEATYRAAGDARARASERIQHLQGMQQALANLEEVSPTLVKRAMAAIADDEAQRAGEMETPGLSVTPQKP